MCFQPALRECSTLQAHNFCSLKTFKSQRACANVHESLDSLPDFFYGRLLDDSTCTTVWSYVCKRGVIARLV
jgi:hypothetical protein